MLPGFGMDDEGSSWVGSVMAFGGIFGSIFGGNLDNVSIIVNDCFVGKFSNGSFKLEPKIMVVGHLCALAVPRQIYFYHRSGVLWNFGIKIFENAS